MTPWEYRTLFSSYERAILVAWDHIPYHYVGGCGWVYVCVQVCVSNKYLWQKISIEILLIN